MTDQQLTVLMEGVVAKDTVNSKMWFTEERGEAMLDTLLAKAAAIQARWPNIAFTDESVPEAIRTEWIVVRLAYLKLSEMWLEHFKVKHGHG